MSENIKKAPQIKHMLLAWYDKNDYNFPWRQSNNPYHVFLSEIMLQQTQIKTVIPYYLNWLKKFPKISDVSNSNIDEVLKLWEGLGYYSRARNFYKSTKIISKKYKNIVPQCFNDFIQLPGVGPYTAGAVLSIAYNQILPAVDSNVVRVFCRIEMNKAPYPKNIKNISKNISKYISNKRPGDFNQSIMDLGREICKSKNPACHICPVSSKCQSFINKCTDRYPVKLKKKMRRHIYMALGIILHNNKILIAKRPNDGLLGGLWEFPNDEIKNKESADECIIRKYKESFNMAVKPTAFIKQIKHEYSHFTTTIDAYFCDYVSGDPLSIDYRDWKWISPKNINLFPFPKANHKLFNEVVSKSTC